MEGDFDGTTLGSVSFESSCGAEVRADINRGIALLHSFWLDEAARVFESVAAKDTGCAIAYWGDSISQLHLINGDPSPADLAAGRAALAKADAAVKRTPRETAYIHALHVFYDGYTPEQYFAHAKRYAAAMGRVAETYPRDPEAKVFYALALLAAEPPDDVALVNSRRAVAILKPLLRRYPKHPGIAHYIIHATDHPEMAKEGLDAARRYALIAPQAPHALHMPSHIFARLGLWQEDIRSNLASKAASERTAGRHIGAENRLHAMEFLEYAYLQIGQENDARQIAEEGKTVKASDVDAAYPDYWAAVQARFAALFCVETQDWAEAARLVPVTGADTYSIGTTLLAHAISAGHTRDAQLGQDAARMYDSALARETVVRVGGSMATLRDEIHAWAAFSRGDVSQALGLLRPVAERQRVVGKGEVELPAGEMLADMLLLDGQAADALQAYQLSLRSDPNRLNALFGAAEAARQAGRPEIAAAYYRKLIENTKGASGSFARRLQRAHDASKAL